MSGIRGSTIEKIMACGCVIFLIVYAVLDNVPFPQSMKVQHVFVAYGHKPLFLPLYFPFLKSIEEFLAGMHYTAHILG